MPAKIIQLPVTPTQQPPKERRKKRDDGLYQVELRYVDDNGVSKKKSFYGKTQTEANKKRDNFKRDLESGIAVDKIDTTVTQWVTKWLETRAKKDSTKATTATYDMYKRESDRLVAAVGKKRLRDVVKSDILSILYDRADKSKSAISKTKLVLRQIFRAAIGDRIIIIDPFESIKATDLPKGSEGSHRALNPAERDLVTQTWKAHRFGPAAMIMLYAGLRRGEVVALEWKNIDLKKRSIHVENALAFQNNRPVDKDTKNSEERDIPIWDPLFEVLQSIKGKKGLVCTAADGKKFSETAVKKAWGSYTNFIAEKQNGCRYRWAGKYLKAKGGQAAWAPCNIRMHDLRHTFCTMLYDAGVDVKRAQYLMGHKSLEVTMKIYTHLSEERKAKSDDAMDKYLKTTVGKSVGNRKKYTLKKL